MQRAILISIVSFAAGAGSSYALLYRGADSADSRLAAPRAQLASTLGRTASLVDALDADVTARARVYQSVVSASAEELLEMAVDALDNVDQAGRSFELNAVLERLSEIDPEAAIEFARQRNLDPARTLEIALNVLDTYRYSEQAIDEIIAALPQLDQAKFRERALLRLAADDPAQALDIALAEFGRGGMSPAFDPISGRNPQTLFAVASSWVERDAEDAVAAINGIADVQARFTFAQAVLSRVAQSDPDTALAYVDAINIPASQKSGLVQLAISQLASRDPERAVRYAETLGGQSGQWAIAMSVNQWAQRDPAAAVNYVETTSTGSMRQSLLSQIASTYGRVDADAALAWAESPSTGRAQIYAAVLSGVAQTDPSRALDIAFDASRSNLPRGMEMQLLMSVIGSAAATGAVPHRTLADRIVALENDQVRQNALQMLGQTWASTDTSGALEWFLNNQQSIGSNVLGDLARQLGYQDPQLAASYTPRVLPELRDGWISAIASSFAQTDPIGAQAWLQQFRGEPAYEAAAAEIIRFSAHADPASAAALWASVAFTDTAQASELVSGIAGSWALQDWLAAREWVATLAPGEIRDMALTSMVSIHQDIEDASVMSLFSSDERLVQAINNVIVQTAQYDAERARAMVAQFLDEPWQRERAEQMIERMQSRQIAGAHFGQGPIAPGVPSTGLQLVSPLPVR